MLRALDDRVLPRAAAGLRRGVDAGTRTRDRVVSSYEAVVGAYRRRPLSVRVRQAPRLSAALAVLLLIAAAGVVAWQGSSGAVRGPSASELQPQTAGAGAVLGPKVGASTQEYERTSMSLLIAAVQGTPGQKRVALVTLGDYRTPEQANALLTGFVVSRVFVRAKAGGKQATPLPIDIHGAFLPQLRRAFADTARSRLQATKAYQGYVDTLSGTSQKDTAFRRLYAAFARSSAIEAQQYAHDCACVYSAVVTATPAQLLSLRARPGVRAVEVAAGGLTALQVQTQPLLPEIVGIVPRPGSGGLS